MDEENPNGVNLITKAKKIAKKQHTRTHTAIVANAKAGELLAVKPKLTSEQVKVKREAAIELEANGKIQDAFTTFERYRKSEAIKIIHISNAGLYNRLKSMGIVKDGEGLYAASDLRALVKKYTVKSPLEGEKNA